MRPAELRNRVSPLEAMVPVTGTALRLYLRKEISRPVGVAILAVRSLVLSEITGDDEEDV